MQRYLNGLLISIIGLLIVLASLEGTQLLRQTEHIQLISDIRQQLLDELANGQPVALTRLPYDVQLINSPKPADLSIGSQHYRLLDSQPFRSHIGRQLLALLIGNILIGSLCAGLGLLTINRLFASFSTLIQTAEQLANQQLEIVKTLPGLTTTDLHKLDSALKTISTQLGSLYNTLETRIAERTRQLALLAELSNLGVHPPENLDSAIQAILARHLNLENISIGQPEQPIALSIPLDFNERWLLIEDERASDNSIRQALWLSAPLIGSLLRQHTPAPAPEVDPH